MYGHRGFYNTSAKLASWEQIVAIAIGVVSLVGFCLFFLGTAWTTIAIGALKILWLAYAITILVISKKANKTVGIILSLAVYLLIWVLGVPWYFFLSAGTAVVLDYVFHQ